MAVTHFYQSGTKHWVFQRFSNLYIVLYSAFILGFIAFSPVTNYHELVGLFDNASVKVFSSIGVFLFALNSVLAAWQIAGDYIKPRLLNTLFTGGCALVSMNIMVFCLYTFWS